MGKMSPTMATHQKNACIQLQANGRGLCKYSRKLTEEDNAFIHRSGRELDAAGLLRKEWEAQAAADHEGVEEEQVGAERHAKRREEKKAEESNMEKGFQPILDLSEFCSLPATKPVNNFLKCQLVWHRVVDGDEEIPPRMFTNGKKGEMKELGHQGSGTLE